VKCIFQQKKTTEYDTNLPPEKNQSSHSQRANYYFLVVSQRPQAAIHDWLQLLAAVEMAYCRHVQNDYRRFGTAQIGSLTGIIIDSLIYTIC